MNEAVWDYRNPYEWMKKTALGSFAPLMINCSITGALFGKEYNPQMPETAEEQVEAVCAAYKEGAVIAHIHARNPENLTEAAADKKIYSEINETIRMRCPGMIINNAIGGGTESTEEKLCCLNADCKPDMASLNTGFFQFNMTLKERKAPLPNPRAEIKADINIPITYSEVRSNAKVMREAGVKPEIQVFHSGQYGVVNDLLRMGLLDKPLVFQLIFGLQSFNYAHPKKFMDMIRELPSGAIFFATGMGPYQLPMNIMSMLCGGHVRVGLEDAVEYKPGVLAESSAQMVARIRRIAEEMNRPLATTWQAREMLGIQ